MQKSQLFQSLLRKKQTASQILSKKSTQKTNPPFHHFSGISQSTQLKIDNNKLYLTHLNVQFRDHLREFIHEQQSYKQTMYQMSTISSQLQNQKKSLQNHVQSLQRQFQQIQIQNKLMINKNNKLLQKIILFQQQNKSGTLRYEEYEKSATILQEDIQYENCLSNQIHNKNKQIIQELQIKSAQIQSATNKMQDVQKECRKKQIKIKKYNQEINTVYFTLENQDNQLKNLCDNIETSLAQQNNLIHDIQYEKDKLTLTVQNSSQKRAILNEQLVVEENLLDRKQDVQFQLRRVEMQLETQENGIDDEYWKIERQRARLIENQTYLQDLKQYITELLQQNQLLQRTLQEQIIQDYAMKKIVDSKKQQPVGKKIKKMLEQYQSCEVENKKIKVNQREQSMKDTRSTFKSTYKQNRNLQERMGTKSRPISPHTPKQLEFMFAPLTSKLNLQEASHKQRSECQRMASTGFTYRHHQHFPRQDLI